MPPKKKIPTRRQKRKRVVLTLKQKMEICQRLEKGENRRVLMQEFNVASSTITDIKARSERLKEFLMESECDKGAEHRRMLHSPKREDLDRALYQWFSLKRLEGVYVSGPELMEKAKELYEEMEMSQPCSFSRGWLCRFKIRHGIRKFHVSGEPNFAATELAEDFCEIVNKLMVEHDLSGEQIYSASETGLMWRCLTSTTLVGTDENVDDGVNRNKNPVTILVCANAAGTHKVKLTVSGKLAKSNGFKGIIRVPVDDGGQSDVCMDADVFTWWFHHVFVPRVKDHLRKIGMPEDSIVVLLLDNVHAHPPEEELVDGNIFVCYLSANLASLNRPVDEVKKEVIADEEHSAERVSWQTTAEGFENIKKFMEQRNCFSEESVRQFDIIHSQFLQKKRKSCNQADIRNLLRPDS